MILVTLIRCCHGVNLGRVAKSLARILTLEVDVKSLVIQIISRV